jgi:predicted negative regulator of RcsB-dependent stress response
MAEEPDDTPRPLAEISHGPSAFEAFLDRNQKGLVVLGIALFAAAAGWIVVRGIKDAAEKEAGAVLAGPQELAELREMIQEHPDTAAAGSAELVIAAKQWEQGDQDAAIETLRAFIAAKPEHPGIPAARASLATRLKQQGKSDEAAELFRQLSEDPQARFLAPYALTALGDLHLAAGRVDEAEQVLKRAKEDFGTNPLSNQAGNHLRLLRFQPPVEIEPAPAPEPPKEPSTDEALTVPDELKGPLGDILTQEDPAPESPPVENTPPPAPVEPAPPQESPAEPVAPPAEEDAPEAPPAEGDSH